MVKYRLTFNRDLCVECGLATGRCPPHGQVIERIFAQNRDKIYENEGGIVFPEVLYPRIQQAVDGCPENAFIIDKIEE